MRWTRELRLTSVTRADGEVVWSWRPDAGAKLCGDDLRSDGGKRARSPGRARRKPLKPLRREGRIASAEPVCSCAFSYVHLHTRPRVQRAPGFPCALYFLRVKSCARLGHFMPRECGPMPSRRLKIQRENAASNAWPAEEIAKHQNSPTPRDACRRPVSAVFHRFPRPGAARP
jgi:hypothetical protein